MTRHCRGSMKECQQLSIVSGLGYCSSLSEESLSRLSHVFLFVMLLSVSLRPTFACMCACAYRLLCSSSELKNKGKLTRLMWKHKFHFQIGYYNSVDSLGI